MHRLPYKLFGLEVKYLFLIFILIFVFRVSECTKHKEPTRSHPQGFTYPLKIGNRWEYISEYSFVNFRPDTLTFPGLDTSFSTSVVEICGVDTLKDSFEAFAVKEVLVEDGDFSQSTSYYKNEKDGLYLYAYKGKGWVIPRKASARIQIYFKGRFFDSIKEILSFLERSVFGQQSISDSIIYEDPPLKSLQYPLRIGVQWRYGEQGEFWRIKGEHVQIDKKVLNLKKVTVPAGRFDCFKILWLVDFDEDGKWDEDPELFDYISSQGLIKRSALLKDITLVVHGKPVGTCDLKEESQLVSYHLE